MDRTRAIFDWIFSLDTREPYGLRYLATSDVGLSPSAVAARRRKEETSANTVREKLSRQYNNLQKVHSFLTTSHDMYAADRLVDRATRTSHSLPIDAATMESYGSRPWTNDVEVSVPPLGMYCGWGVSIVLLVQVLFFTFRAYRCMR